MKYRKLRIAWSVAWGAVAVMLCMLWILSHWWDVFAETPTVAVLIASRHGQFSFECDFERVSEDGILSWDVYREKIDNDYERIDLEPEIIFLPKRNILCVEGFHWQLVIAAIAIGSVVWLPLRRFSVRTLLIATTLVAVVLGLIMWMR
jgi:hypothetical protein